MKNNLIKLDLQDNLAILFMNSPPNNLISNQFLDSLQKNIYDAAQRPYAVSEIAA